MYIHCQDMCYFYVLIFLVLQMVQIGRQKKWAMRPPRRNSRMQSPCFVQKILRIQPQEVGSPLRHAWHRLKNLRVQVQKLLSPDFRQFKIGFREMFVSVDFRRTSIKKFKVECSENRGAGRYEKLVVLL